MGRVGWEFATRAIGAEENVSFVGVGGFAAVFVRLRVHCAEEDGEFALSSYEGVLQGKYRVCHINCDRDRTEWIQLELAFEVLVLYLLPLDWELSFKLKRD